MTNLKKKSRKIFALFTTAATILSAVSLPAFAANEYNYTLTEKDPDTLYERVSVDLDSDYTSAEFIEALKGAGEENAFLTVFDDSGFPYPEQQKKEIGVMNVINGDKTVSITKDMDDVVFAEAKRYQWGYWYISGETMGESLVLLGTTGIPFTYRFSKVRGGAKDEYVTSLGISIRSKDEVEVVATYASLIEETTQTATVTIPSDTDTIGYFFGLKAPENYYIQSIVFTAKTAFSWPFIDDMCFITSEVEAPPSVATDIKISGKETIITPPYKSTNTYTYAADVFDQYGEKMPDEEVEYTLLEPEESESVSFQDGVLTVKQHSDVPSEIKIGASVKNTPEISDEFTIEVTGDSPYYNSDLIGVPDGNPEYTLSEFKSDLDEASVSENGDMTIINFLSDGTEYVDNEVHMPLHKTGYNFGMKRVGNTGALKGSDVVDGYFGSEYPQKVTPTAGNKILMLSPGAGKNTFSFITENTDGMLVKKLGFAVLTYNAMKVETGFKITANFSDGTTGVYGKDVPGGGGASGNTFFGIEAPEGHFITQLDIETSNKVWNAVSEFGFILGKRDPSVAADIALVGKQEIVTPAYHAKDTYTYSTQVVDQYGQSLPDEEIELTMTSPADNPSVSFADGVLTIKQSSDVPDVIKLTATAVNVPGLSKTFEIKVTGTPYYNEDLIGVPDGNPEYVLSDFKADLAAAATSEGKDFSIINLLSEEFQYSGSDMYMPLDKSKKQFGMRRVGANLAPTVVQDGTFGGQKVTPSVGDKMIVLVPKQSGENTYNFITGDLGKMRVTKLGFVMLTYNPMSTKDGFAVTATFSDGTTRVYSKNIAGGGTASGNTFFGISAPAGHYITQLDIETVSGVWSAVSEFAYILEEPDTLTLDEAYSNMMFSSVTTQDLKNIRENLNFYTTTPEGATIMWDSDKPDVINPDTGVVTLPDISENSSVKITANISYGFLSKPRNFSLYVPSKLELDANALSLPENLSENITLPTKGSLQGSKITWVSDAPQYITSQGVVTRPSGRDGYAILTATLSNNSGSITKKFPINISGSMRNESLGSGSSGGGGGGGGGRGSIPAVSVPAVTPPEVLQQKTSFTDVETSHWAYRSIMKLYEKGIVNGVGDGKFNPDGTVTREQFVSMLVRAMEFKLTDTNLTFSDVEKGGWYEDAVKIAAGLDIVSGRNDGSFGIGHNITREDMAVMVYRAMEAAGKELSEGEAVKWDDEEMISDYAMQAISFLRQNGIINGVTETSFSPKTTTTRAQAAAIIYRITEGV